MNGRLSGEAAAVRAAAGAVLYRRRSALGLSLLDLNHQTGLPLLLLVNMENGCASPLRRDAFAQVLRALGFAGPCDVLWEAASGPHEERAGTAPDGRRHTTADAAQRFLQVARAAELGALLS